MLEYINRIKKLGADDYVNGDTFNTIISQLQHNIDLLYRSQASSVQNWNISEMIFGNLLDYDQVGQKRYVNGGKLDSLEKILPFSNTIGELNFEETTILNNDNWLRWDLPGGVKENIKLTRNIVIPEALRHQQILLGFKFMPFVGNVIKTNERYEIYVNGVYSGTGETGTNNINGIVEPKTIYGVYNLTGEETNLQIELVRSITNGVTPLNYTVRISKIFVGLHTLGNSSFTMNYPASGSFFMGASSDIDSFYNFENNAIRPIPSFLINNSQLDGGNSLTVNITSQAPSFQNEYWVGISGTGNQLGTTFENIMNISDFLLIESFESNVTTVHLQNTDEIYPEMLFDKGNYELFIENAFDYLQLQGIIVSENSSVNLEIEPHNLSTRLKIDKIDVNNHSRLNIKAKTGSNEKLRMINNSISVGQSSFLNIETGTFAMPILNGQNFYVYEGGKAQLKLNVDSFTNAMGEYGFGMSLSTIHLDQYAYLDIENIKPLTHIKLHIGNGSNAESVVVDNHSHLVIKGFNRISTSSTIKKFKGKLHSSIEIFDHIQSNGGPTAFTDIELELFSTFGSPLLGGTLTENLLESFVYEII